MQPALCRVLFAVLAGLVLPLALLPAQPPASPRVGIVLKDRHGHATPERIGTTHTGAGNTDVAGKPGDDTVVITLTGVAVAGPRPAKASSAAMSFDLNQAF